MIAKELPIIVCKLSNRQQVLQKNCEVTEASWSRQVIPTKCTHMIKLVRYFETESTIYLLLEYAPGLCLV